MILTHVGDQLIVASGSAVDTDVVVDYLDYIGGPAAQPTPGDQRTNITGAVTIVVLNHPGGSTGRVVTNVSIHNKHASSSNLVTLSLYDSTNLLTYELDSRTLQAGETVAWNGGSFTQAAPAIPARPVQALTVATVLVASDSGKILTLGTAGGFNVALPAPVSGLFFTFIVKVAPTTVYTITTNGTTQNVIHGLTVSAEDAQGSGDSTSGTAVDVITFAANKAQIGDRVEMVCNGTVWYAVAYATQQDAITFD